MTSEVFEATVRLIIVGLLGGGLVAVLALAFAIVRIVFREWEQ